MMTSSKSSDPFPPIILFLSLLTLAALSSCPRSTPAAADEAPPTVAAPSAPALNDYIEMVDSARGHRLADGGLLFLSRDKGEVRHLFLQKGDSLRQLTQGPDQIDRYTVDPTGSRVLYQVAQGGNEQYDVYLLDPATGAISPLLVDPAVRYDSILWVDAERFLYTANEVSRRDFYIYRFDIATGKKTLLIDRQGTHAVADAWGPDRFLFATLLGSGIAIPHQYENGKARKLKGTRDDRYYDPVGYWHDGRILMITDEERDVAYLELRDRTGARETVFAGTWPVEAALIDVRTRTEAVFCTNEEGWSVCRLWQKGALRELPIARGVVRLDHFSEGRLVYTLSRPDALARPHLLEIGTGTDTPFGITDTRGIATESFIAPQLRRTASFDGESIPYFFFTPQDTKPPYRTIVYFHGGPEGQSRPGSAPIFQYLLHRGFAVALPNVRGSTGYGKRFRDLDNYKKRMDAVRDVGPLLDDLVNGGIARADRFIAWGGSYGGFMTVASMAQYPDRFRCGIDVVGVVDFLNFLKNTKSYRKALREAEYGPLSDEAFLRSISPTHMTDRIKGRLLIAHGANDPRVPVSDAYILAKNLTNAQNPPEMLIFDDEGHGFRKKKNRLAFYERAVTFLEGCAPNL